MLMLKVRCYCPHCYDKLSKTDRELSWPTKRAKSEGILASKEDVSL